MASSQVSYAANSEFVAQRVAHAWNVEAKVIYPPVDIDGIRDDLAGNNLTTSERALLAELPSGFVLGASRFVPYKRMESAIEVGELLDLPVVLVGEGPDEDRVRSIADDAQVPVTFVGRVSDPMLRALYAGASLFVFLAVEDFGIMPVEAMACGTPVLVNRVGGAAESVGFVAGGRMTDPESVQDLSRAAAEAVDLDMIAAQAAVDEFSGPAFRKRLRSWVETQC
jgi:glycosyltransferase involved in cell wall biosynthesis